MAADKTMTGKVSDTGPYQDSRMVEEAQNGKDPGNGVRIGPLTGPLLPFGQFPRQEQAPPWGNMVAFGKG